MKNLKIFLSAAAFAAACQSGAQMLTSGPTPINILAPQWKMGVSADAAGEFSLPADMSEDLGGDLGVYSAGTSGSTRRPPTSNSRGRIPTGIF